MTNQFSWYVRSTPGYLINHVLPLSWAYQKRYGRSLPMVCSKRPEFVDHCPTLELLNSRKTRGKTCLCFDIKSFAIERLKGRRAILLHHSLISKGILGRLSIGLLLRSASKIILPANHIMDDVHSLIPRKCLLRGPYLPFDWRREHLTKSQLALLGEWTANDKPKVLVCLALNDEETNNALVQIADQLKSQDCCSLALKVHPANREVQSNLSSHLIFKDYPTIPLLRSADLVVSCYSSTALEAQMLGTPVRVFLLNMQSTPRMTKADHFILKDIEPIKTADDALKILKNAGSLKDKTCEEFESQKQTMGEVLCNMMERVHVL